MIHYSIFKSEKLHRIFFYLTILLLPTQLGLHFWPNWAMVLGRKVDYLSPTLYLTDILIFATVVSWIWISSKLKHEAGIMNHELGKQFNKTKSYFIIHYSLFIILVAGFVAVNIFSAANQPVAIYHWFKFGEYFLLAYYIYKTKPELAKIIFVSAVSVLYSSVIAISQFLLQHSIGGPFWFLGERTFSINTPGIATVKFCQPFSFSCSQILRAYGTFPHPNVSGRIFSSYASVNII